MHVAVGKPLTPAALRYRASSSSLLSSHVIALAKPFVMRAADNIHANARFLTIARDPRMLPGIYRYCDEWCARCPATERCLLFKCRKEFSSRARDGARHARLRATEEIALNRQLDACESPRESLPSTGPMPYIETHVIDALAGVALEYATRSGRFVEGPAPSRRAPASTHRPPAFETIWRFHSAIYAKTARALVAGSLAASGMPAWYDDAIRSAARVFAYAARSRPALTAVPESERRVLLSLLDRVVQGLEQHFPAAMAAHRRAWPALSGAERQPGP